MSPQERADILRNAPPMSWIALSEDESKVVAYGGSYDEVVARAESEGEADPVLIMTPDSWDPLVL